MSRRLNILFNNSPEDDVQTLREVVGMGYEKIPFSQFARWRLASKQGNIWSLDIDVVPYERSKVVYILPTLTAEKADVEAIIKEVTSTLSIPLFLENTKDFSGAQREKIMHDCVEICDRIFVVNSDSDVDPDTQSIIDYGKEVGKNAVYLKY